MLLLCPSVNVRLSQAVEQAGLHGDISPILLHRWAIYLFPVIFCSTDGLFTFSCDIAGSFVEPRPALEHGGKQHCSWADRVITPHDFLLGGRRTWEVLQEQLGVCEIWSQSACGLPWSNLVPGSVDTQVATPQTIHRVRAAQSER